MSIPNTPQVRPIVQPPPMPWKLLTTWAVGGLIQVGYAEDSDLLLVLSHQGRGVFDCKTAEKVARDYDDMYEQFNPTKFTATGFGPLGGQAIRMAGLFGGGLPRSAEGEWFLSEEAPAWPTRSIYLRGGPQDLEDVCVGHDGSCELRAYGFSETGRTFVIATSCDLMIFARDLS